MLLPDQAELHIGDVPMHFAQPRDVAVAAKTMIRGTEKAPLEIVVPTAQEPLKSTPPARWALGAQAGPDDRGQQKWVLRNTRTGRYLELDDRDVFIWQRLDGYNTCAISSSSTRSNTESSPCRASSAPCTPSPISNWSRRLRALRHAASANGSKPCCSPDFDRGLTRLRPDIPRAWLVVLHQALGRRLVAAHPRRPGGHVCRKWTQTALRPARRRRLGRARGRRRLPVALVIHESAHALAVKSYGRKVTRGGFMLLLGMPLAFHRHVRHVVWLALVAHRGHAAGPLSTAGSRGCARLRGHSAPGNRRPLAYTLASACT
jgi:putative peptide zinc metalloprotease protein